MRDDRRGAERLAPEPDRELTLAAMLGGVPLVASVRNLSRKGLRVSLCAGSPAPETGGVLSDAFLGPADAQGVRLGSLTVAETLHSGSALELRLVTADAGTRGALWHAMDRLAQGLPLAQGDVAVRAPAPPRIPARGIYTEEARLERLAFLRRETGAALAPLAETRLSAERLTGNIENLIGAVEVPVGLAGPLLVRGGHARGLFYAPMATTEGAMVASATRGATAITRAGGVTARVIRQQMMRVPLFVLSSLEATLVFARWVRDHLEELQAEVGSVSRHAALISVEPIVIGRMVHVRFMYDTADAAGQNMTTACTWQACQWIMRETQHLDGVEVDSFLVEANISGDKKVNYRSFLHGRGTRVVAECMIPGDVLEQVLKVTPAELAQANAAVMAGSIQAGMIGYNINVANVIAAMFTATGQDIACVHESALGQLHIQASGDAIYASMVLPSLIIGTVGGGTHLPGQHALLESLGCAGTGKVERLAEIIGGFCLALDLSTLAAVASGEFASAHERLGRSRPVRWFTQAELDAPLLEPGLRRVLGDPALTVRKVEPLPVAMGASILSELTARKVSKLCGLVPLLVSHSQGATEVIAKVKPLDEEIVLMTATMASMCGPLVAAAYKKWKRHTGFAGTHLRELGIYQQTDPRFLRHVPAVYGTHRDDAREAYVVLLERLADVELLDSADDPRGWTPAKIETALAGLGALHAVWLGREPELRAQEWLGPVQGPGEMAQMRELWEALAVHAAEEFPELIGPSALALRRRLIRTLPEWWTRLAALPQTLIHNDFNPRNVALRRGGALVAYDWELATVGAPQHDLAELLCFVLGPDASAIEVARYLEVHRAALERESGQPIDAVAWREGYRLSLRDLAVNRMALYLMAHTFRHYGFMARVVKTLHRLLALEGDAHV